MTKSRVAAVKMGDISDSLQHPPFRFPLSDRICQTLRAKR